MEKLIEALEIRKKYNQMPFDEFIKEYEEWSGEKVSEENKRIWNLSGLNNVDFVNKDLKATLLIVTKNKKI